MTTSTTNYGWIKPDVGASDDVWGGQLNTDLDNIDSTVKSVSNVANAAYPASNPTGYQTAAQVTTALAPYAPLASPALTGNPTAPTPTAGDNDTSVATTAFVTTAVATYPVGDNRIINGDMRIDQRNNGASGTAQGYMVDRWQFFNTQAGKGTWQRVTNAPSALIGFPYALAFGSSSAYASLASDRFIFIQSIEADQIGDFAWGTANAQPVTLSFWALSSLTGTFGGSVKNNAGTRSYPFVYTLPTASVWTKVIINIPGDTAGAWVMSGNVGSAQVNFNLGGGSTFLGPVSVWASANYDGGTGSQSIVATNGATFTLTGVKLEIGSVATPFNRQSLAKSLADCQRYYCVKSNIAMLSYGVATAQFGCPIALPVTMRASPTSVLSGQSYSNASGLTAINVSPDGVVLYASVTGSGGAQWTTNLTASAEL